jgi:hypothetical protein
VQKEESINNKQVEHEKCGQGLYNTFTVLEQGTMGLQAFHDDQLTFPTLANPFGVLCIVYNPSKNLLIIAYHL